MEKAAKKCEKDANAQKAKVRKALQQKNVEGAQIYAENAIRKRTEGNNYLRMAARLDAVSNRVQTAMMMKDVTKQLGGVVQGLDKVLASMDLEKIDKVMAKFEQQFENLDVHAGVMEGAMSSATTLSTPATQVDDLLREVAEESGLEIEDKLKDAPQSETAAPTEREESQLTHRLQQLRDTALEN